MIFTDGARAQGPAYLEDAPLTTSETIGAAVATTWHEYPVRQLLRMGELSAAQRNDEGLESQLGRLQAGEDLADVVNNPRRPTEIPIEDARARVKEAGLEKTLTLPEQPVMNQRAFDIMLERARERRERDAIAARGASGFVPNALAMGTSFLVGAVDPINLASAFIPVVGEMRYAKLLHDAGGGALARAAVRAPVGAASGAVGSVPIIGLEAAARHQEGQDFTMADALRNLMFGTILGGTLHPGGGTVADLIRTRRSVPLYPRAEGEPFGPPAAVGSPLDAVPAARTQAGPDPEFRTEPEMPRPAGGEPALPGDIAPAGDPAARIRAKLAAAEPARAEPPEDLWPHDTAAFLGTDRDSSPVVRAIDDLPAQAREDAMRVAIADLVEGRPVAVGQMLEAAAKTDPRIAESIDAWHASPHDFDRFDMSKIGTGEGAQTYGHGLYFAENPAVSGPGGAYPKNFERVTVNGEPIDPNNPLHVVADALFKAGETNLSDPSAEMRLRAQQSIMGMRDPTRRDALEILKYPTKLEGLAIQPGNSYRVRITADRSRMLDWDAPISEQPQALRDLLAKYGITESITGGPIKTGEDALRALQLHLATGKKLPPDANGFYRFDDGREAAAAALRDAGIPGIKYLDQGSRLPPVDGLGMPTGGEMTNTHNFVIFDDKLVEITHKNGEPVSRGERQELLRESKGGATVLQGPRAARGPRARDPETWTLNEFLASRGGLNPNDPLIGDVRHAIGTSNKFVPGFGHLIRKGGMRLDEAREAAVEAGYLFDAGDHTGGQAQTTIDTLLQAMDRELRGDRVYRTGREPEAKGPSAEDNRAFIEREAVGALRDEGIDPVTVPDKTLARVVQIMEREGERDALIAYERAVMEETHYGAEAGQHERVADHIPGWDLPHDPGAAPGAGAAAGEFREGGPGGAARAAGGGDREAPGAAAGLDDDWRTLAARPHEYDHPEILEASRAADSLGEPVSTIPTKRQAAAEQAAAAAEQAYKDAEAYLPQDLRDRVEQELKLLQQDSADAVEVIRRGAACLVAGAAGAAA